MKVIFLFISIILTIQTSFGQKSDVYDELTSSFDYAKTAISYGNNVLGYIKKCGDQSSLEDMQYYARKAKSEADDARLQSDYAETDAGDAEDEADEISCDDAENEADDAESNFSTADSRFDDAYSYLKKAEYSDNTDDLIYYLKKAKDSAENGIRYAEDGLSDLQDAVNELNDCN